MSRTDRDSPDPRLIRHALEKLRGRNGLTAARLLASQDGDAAALLELGSVRRHATVHSLDLPQAALEIIRERVRDDLQGTTRVVADAVLGLGVFVDTYTAQQMDARVVAALSSNLLGHRRETLLSRWDQLHRALGLIPTDLPSDRALRGTLEPEMLAALAEHLLRREALFFEPTGSRSATPAGDPSPDGRDAPPGRVIVVGGAVMDAKYRTRTPPQVNRATEARSFSLAPGGKGLYQAIATARLGLKTSLVAAVARDRFGDEIVSFLDAQGVDTSLLKRIDHASTPLVTIIEGDLGESAAIYYRDPQVCLEPLDLERVADRLNTCDAVLLTFELPRATLEAALQVIGERRNRRPIVVVSPGQPYDAAITGRLLSVIDYLVAREPELGQYQTPGRKRANIVEVASDVLLTYGVGTICVTGTGGCNVYSRSVGSFPVPGFPSSYREAAIARDAFSAALAARLLEHDGEFSEEVALWATAAMAAATADHALSNPMPDWRGVQQMLDRSPFSVSLRPTGHSRANNPAS